jgi:GxxExxY protein
MTAMHNSPQSRMQESTYKHSEVTDKILAAFYTVYNALGYGFLEKVYENALAIEIASAGLSIIQQQPIIVEYKGQIIGEYCADLIVESRVLVEIKTAKAIAEGHEAQLLNYLKATPYEVGLLLNFGPKPEIKRRAFDNSRKEGYLKNQIKPTHKHHE